jgi:hypothetical protein
VEELEAWIVRCLLGNGYRFTMLCNPSRDALSDAKFEAVDDFRMRIFGCAKDQFIAFENVDQAGIALHESRSKIDDAVQNVIKSIGGPESLGNFVQYINM